MALIEQSGLMKHKDTDGNVYLLYPITTKENVDGLENIDAHLENSEIHVTTDDKNTWNSKAEGSHTHDSTYGVTTSGTGSAYTATVDGIDSLTAGVGFVMIPHTGSTVTNPTLDVNGLGAKYIRRPVSGSFSMSTVGDSEDWIMSGKPVRLTYNGTFWITDNFKPNVNDLYGTAPIEKGGTGADNADDARVNLGIQTGDGTTTSANADYAEVGEWTDGNADDEDRIGYFVAVDTSSAGPTMVKAISTADVRGVTVTAPAFSGNCADSKFDESGNLLQQYDYVAVMGLVSVIDNGTCTVNGRCMPDDNGTAIPSANDMGYQVIDRVDDTHVLIAVEPGADMIQRIKTFTNTTREALDGKANVPTVALVTLSSFGWNFSPPTQTVSVAGILSDESKQIITPTPASSSQTVYYDSCILCTGQATDSLTFTAKTTPTEDVAVYIVIQEVNLA